MADQKTTELTALTALSGDETLYIVEDDDGTPVSRRITIEHLAAGLAARSELTGAFAPLTIQNWTAFTPTFGQYGGTTATLGNGTLSGSYNRIGDLIHYRLGFVWGSTTVHDGFFLFGLPVAMVAGTPHNFPVEGWAYLEDLSTAAFMGFPRFQIGSGAIDILPAGAAGAAGNPFGPADGRWTWGNGDFVNISGSYRCAP